MAILGATDICNMALGHLRQPAIASLSGETERSRLCRLWYDQTRQELLNTHTWNFAIKRAVLAADAEPTAPFGYDYSFKLPKDFIRFISIGEDVNDKFKYDIEGDRILTVDAFDEGLLLRYVCDYEDVSKMPPLFKKLLALQLALNMAYAVTQNQQDIGRINALYENTIYDAMAINGQESPPDLVEDSDYLLARKAGF